MRIIKAFTLLAVLATLGWCAAWFAGSRALDRAITAGLAHVPEITAESHEILGFPNRFDVTFTEPRINAGGVEWAAPFVQIFALTYRPHHLLAVFAHDQVLRAAGSEASLHTDDLRASLVMTPDLDLPLERFTLVGQHLAVLIDGATHRADTLRLASRRTGDQQHEVALLAENVFADTAVMERRDPDGLWPRQYTEVRLDAELEFDRPLDRHLFDGSEPTVTRLTLTGGRLAWGESTIGLAGRLTPGDTGQLSGDIVLTITGWTALMARTRAAGLLSDDNRGLLSPVLNALAAEVRDDRLEVPLAVVDGDVRIGPLLLGSLPLLR